MGTGLGPSKYILVSDGVTEQAFDDSVVKFVLSINTGFLFDDDTTSTFIVLFELVPKQFVALIVKEKESSFSELPDITPLLKVNPVGNIELKQAVPPETVPFPLTITGADVTQTDLL